jgi:hypothetical protein
MVAYQIGTVIVFVLIIVLLSVKGYKDGIK